MTDYDVNNVFARIIRKEIPTKIICEGKHTICFNDLNPKAKIHVLVIPKGQYTDILDFSKNATAEEKTDYWNTLDKLTENLGIKESGFNLQINTGENGGQEIPHFHTHVLAGKRN